MSGAKHTPGPWTAEQWMDDDSEYRVAGPGRQLVTVVQTHGRSRSAVAN